MIKINNKALINIAWVWIANAIEDAMDREGVKEDSIAMDIKCQYADNLEKDFGIYVMCGGRDIPNNLCCGIDEWLKDRGMDLSEIAARPNVEDGLKFEPVTDDEVEAIMQWHDRAIGTAKLVNGFFHDYYDRLEESKGQEKDE